MTESEEIDLLNEKISSLMTTFVKIADHLGIDCEAARKLPGKPSDVFIAAINQIKDENDKLQTDVIRLKLLLNEAYGSISNEQILLVRKDITKGFAGQRAYNMGWNAFLDQYERFISGGKS